MSNIDTVIGSEGMQELLSQLDTSFNNLEFVETLASTGFDVSPFLPQNWKYNMGCTVYSFAMLNVKRYWTKLKKRLDEGEEGQPRGVSLAPVNEGWMQWLMMVRLSDEIIKCVRDKMKEAAKKGRGRRGHEGVGGHTGWPASKGSVGLTNLEEQKWVIPCKRDIMIKRGIYPKYKGRQSTAATGAGYDYQGPSGRRSSGVPLGQGTGCPCIDCPPPQDKPECYRILSFFWANQIRRVGGRWVEVPGATMHQQMVKIIECKDDGSFIAEVFDMVGLSTESPTTPFGPTSPTIPSIGFIKVNPNGRVAAFVPSPGWSPDAESAARNRYEGAFANGSTCDVGEI